MGTLAGRACCPEDLPADVTTRAMTDDDLPVEFEDVPVLGKPFAPEDMLGVVQSVFGPPRLTRRAIGG